MMSDILSSFSLLLTIVTVLYGTWYQEIKTAIDHWEDIPDPSLKKQYQEYLKGKRNTLRTKLLPLMIAGVVLAVLLIPVAWRIIADALSAFQQYGCEAVRLYDTVQATVLVVFVFAAILCVNLCWQSIALKKGIEKRGAASEKQE